jgi:formate/nitrite transporter FocA (FNT family)
MRCYRYISISYLVLRQGSFYELLMTKKSKFLWYIITGGIYFSIKFGIHYLLNREVFTSKYVLLILADAVIFTTGFVLISNYWTKKSK